MDALKKAFDFVAKMTQERATRIAAAEAMIKESTQISSEATAEMQQALETANDAAYIAARRRADDAAARREFAEKTIEKLRNLPLAKEEENAEMLLAAYRETLQQYKAQTQRVLDALQALIEQEQKAAAIADSYRKFCDMWRTAVMKGKGEGYLHALEWNSGHFHLQRHINTYESIKAAPYMKD